MNKGIGIGIGVIAIIIISIIIISFNSEEVIKSNETWNGVGQVQIDKDVYVLGEKVFINIVDLSSNEKGELSILRPVNATYYVEHLTIPFDGSIKSSSYTYFQPRLFEFKGICTIDDVTGNWKIKINGLEQPSINFEVTSEFLIDEDHHMWDVEIKRWDPVC